MSTSQAPSAAAAASSSSSSAAAPPAPTTYAVSWGVGAAAAGKCKLCGVPRAQDESESGSGSRTMAGWEMEAEGADEAEGVMTTRGPTHARARAQTQAQQEEVEEIPCPRCTYLNDPHVDRCEICGGRLPPAVAAAAAAALTPPTTTTTPTPPPPETEIIRLSFRKGGDKDLYKRLKTVLASRMWEEGGEGPEGGRAWVAVLLGVTTK
ncbi:hypothetical protein QFC24_005071 [Naganishia onofrii]|uniref:Uncharacterized protein n=1 Tax=Naganishia onofrii TaxID=1851511 RepID=A0ACC2XAP2_9TREE|nr:hypothetical protein QFC24_005071 [Naganishia onofrii]